MGDDGILYPMGGTDTSLLANNGANANNIWSNNAADPWFRCVDGNIGTGWGCTARVIAENYRINY